MRCSGRQVLLVGYSSGVPITHRQWQLLYMHGLCAVVWFIRP